jgi:DnaJ-class molecular chaperone
MNSTIYPLTTCPKCKGTGRDEDATKKIREQDPSASGHVRCSLCNGHGDL